MLQLFNESLEETKLVVCLVLLLFSFQLFELSLILKYPSLNSLQDGVIDWTKIYFIDWKTILYSAAKKWSVLSKIAFFDFSRDCCFANQNEFSYDFINGEV